MSTYNEKLTIVIPFFGQCRYRLRNLHYVIEKLNQINIKPVVVEQIYNNRQVIIPGEYEHLLFRYVNNKFNKNSLILDTLHFIKSEYIWMLDADCVVDFEKIINNIEYNSNCIQPQYNIKFLTELESQQLLNNQQTIDQLNKTKSYLYNTNIYGATSYIINREFALNNNVYDTGYFTWGLEDYDLFMSCDKLTDIDIMYNNTGVHLWHPENLDKQPSYINNLKYFEQRHGSFTDIKNYIAEKYKPKCNDVNITI